MRSLFFALIVVESLVMVSARSSADDAVKPEAEKGDSDAPEEPRKEADSPFPLDALPQWLLEKPLELHRPLKPRTLSDQEKLEAYAYYSMGRLLESRQDLTGALKMYQLALRHDPEALAIYDKLVPLAFRLNRGSEAMRYLLKQSELNPSDQLRLRRLASYLAQPDPGDLVRAIRYLELALVAPNMVHDSPDFVDVKNELGRLYYATGDFAKSADAYQAVMEALGDPDRYRLDRASLELLASDRNYEQIGKAFLKAARANDAIAAFEKAEETATNKGRFSYNLAQVYFETGDYQKALEELTKYFDRGLSARNEEPYELLKRTLEQLNQTGELIGFLERATERDPQNSVLQTYLANEYRAAGQFDQAEAVYRSILERSESNEADEGLAQVYLETKQPAKLLAALAKIVKDPKRGVATIADEIESIADDSDFVDALAETARNTEDLSEGSQHVMALIAASAERVESAAEFFELAISRQPEDASLYEEFGRMHTLNNQHEQAAAVYQRAIDRGVAPNSPSLHVSLAQNLELAGQTEQAIAAAQGALNISDNILTRYYYAWVFYHARRFEEARAQYETLIETAHESPLAAQNLEFVTGITRNARFILSNIYFEMGDLPRAEEMLEQVLEQEPDDARANNDLGYLLADQGKALERAESMVRKAIEKEPENAAYLDSLGWVLYKKGDFTEAIDFLEKAVKILEEGDSVIWDHLGDAYLRTDQVDKARSAWQKAIELHRKQREPDEKKIEEIQAKLNVTGD